MGKPPPRKAAPGKAPAKKRAGPPPQDFDDDAPPSKPARRRAGWPYALLMLLVWGAIFGGIVFSHYISGLPDVRNLMSVGASQDVTILDDRERLVARRGLTQG